MSLVAHIKNFTESHDPAEFFSYVINLKPDQQLESWSNPLVPCIFVSSALNRFANTFSTLTKLGLKDKFLPVKLHIIAFSLLNQDICDSFRVEILTFLTIFDDLGVDGVVSGLMAIQTMKTAEIQLGIKLISQSQKSIPNDSKSDILSCCQATIQKSNGKLDTQSMRILMILITDLE